MDVDSMRPSIYAQMLWEQRLLKARDNEKTMQWFVVRNRMQNVVSKSSVHIGSALATLSKKFGFTVIKGFRERSIFRELFPSGLTVLDKDDSNVTTISHVSAKQELRTLMNSIL